MYYNFKKKDFLKNFTKIKFIGYEMPIYKSIDIDNMKDWNLALNLYKMQKKFNTKIRNLKFH